MNPETEELTLITRQWDKAMISNDAMAITQFMTEDWIIVGENGPVSKQDFMEPVLSGLLSHSRMDSDNMQIRLYGDTAIVISRGTSAGMYQGHHFHLYEWSVNLFRKENEKWQCVLTMLCPARPD